MKKKELRKWEKIYFGCFFFRHLITILRATDHMKRSATGLKINSGENLSQLIFMDRLTLGLEMLIN